MIVNFFISHIYNPLANFYNPTNSPSLNGSALKISDPEREKELIRICEGTITIIHDMDCSNKTKELAIQRLLNLFPKHILSQAKINLTASNDRFKFTEAYWQRWY